jgi:HEAT repeat protein
VRIACAGALAEIGSAAAIDALIGALDVPVAAIRDDALFGLRLLSGEDHGIKPLAWRAWARARRE